MGRDINPRGSNRTPIALVVVLLAGGAAVWAGQKLTAAQTVAAPASPTASTQPYVVAASPIEAGRYLIKVGGCNDCHTPGFAMKGGQVPESEWLTGDVMGYRGPWGTTYASNLRLFVKDLSEADFLTILRNRNSRPPMPWPSLHAMSDTDLRSIYAYLKSFEVKGDKTPDYVAPTDEPKTPFINMQPILPPATPAGK